MGNKILFHYSPSILIYAICDNASIPVFLYELAVSYVVTICSFESCSVLVNLNGLTISDSVVIGASELAAISIMYYDETFKLPVLELSFIYILSLVGKLALTVLTVSFPVAYVYVAICPCHGAESRFVSFQEMTGIFVTI